MKKLTEQQWENLCDNCGKCCLIKLQDEDSDEVFYTNIICKYYDLEHSLCSIYEKRCEIVPACLKLDQNNVDKIAWMPKTCAYRSLFEKDFKPAKPKSLKGRVISEDLVLPQDLENHIVNEEDL